MGAAGGVSVAPERPAGDPFDGERKTVTALFADIKGSMELMEDLDPEEARTIVDPALRLMIDAVQRYDGYIVQSTGDGIFALFGAPMAHEDHPQRALYAALRMQEDLRRYSDRLRAGGGLPIQARAGVNTGEVVIRSITTGEGHTEYTPIGHTANLASRMQTLAPVGSVAVTEATRKLCEGYFAFKSLGPTTVKGVSEPVNVAEVTGLGPLRTRLQAAAQRGFTKFVGRQAELEQMKGALELARQGHGQMVAAMGEPGVGKSRLFFEFKAVAASGCLVLDAYSVSHGKASVYLPVFELLREYFRIVPDDDPRQRREKVIGKVLGLDRSLEDALPYVFALLGLQEGEDPLAQMDAQIRRRRTQDALKRILLRESLNQPLILVFEDLHWIDTETQALLNLLADSIANARILLMVNYRPEYHHQWGSRTHYTQLRLDPLGSESADVMLTALLGDAAEVVPLKRVVAERSQGNPFFIEEIIQALFDEGVLVRNGAVKVARALSQVRLPPTVQGILAARIDRLPAQEKELLQALAVIGREFPLSLIRSVTQASGEEIERILADLQLGEFVYEQPAFPEVEYTFKHALTQEVAYNSVLTQRRKLLHERAAAAMELLYGGRLEDHLDQLAYQYSRSDNVAKAVEYLHLASGQALRRSHYNEAIAHARAALKLFDRLPDSPDRLRSELAVQVTFGQACMVTMGPTAPEVEKAFHRAEVICRQLGNAVEMFSVLLGLWLYCLAIPDVRRAQKFAEQLLEIGLEEGRPELVVNGYCCLGASLYCFGRFDEALGNLEQAIARYPGPTAVNNGVDALVQSLHYGSFSALLLGHVDKALKMSTRELEHATLLNQPYSIAIAQVASCVVLTFRGDSAATAEAEALIALSTEHAFPYPQVLGGVLRSLALLERASAEEALAGLSEGTGHLRMMGARLGLGTFIAGLAEAYGKAGNPGRGLIEIADRLSEMEATSEMMWEAELYRVRGELLLMQNASNTAQAEQSFRKAIDVARRQNAKFWELRATKSLARLLVKHGRRDEARAMLAEIYAWFTEGFDTADLKDAKVLLNELNE